MGKALTVGKTIDQLVVEIAEHVYDLQGAENRRNKLRLSAGLKLLELRHLVEANGEDWWDWWEANKERLLLRSRKDSEKYRYWRLADLLEWERTRPTSKTGPRERAAPARLTHPQ